MFKVVGNENVRRFYVTVAEISALQEEGRLSHLANNLTNLMSRHIVKPFLEFLSRSSLHKQVKAILKPPAFIDLYEIGTIVIAKGQLLLNPLEFNVAFRASREFVVIDF